MAKTTHAQTDLFGTQPPCEYYPVLVPDAPGLREIVHLNQVLLGLGLKPSQLTRLPHISMDGVTCPEDDQKVMREIGTYLATQKPIAIDFTEVGYFPGRGGITLKLGIRNPDLVLEFNKLFMAAIRGKTTKLNLHLTLARYVDRQLFETLKQPEVIYPKTCMCRSVAVLKKLVGAKGAYVNIGMVEFGGGQAGIS